MAIYHFHLTHSEEMRDETGVELESLGSAKRHAVQISAELLCEDPAWFWEAETFRVTVTDGNGLQLLTVEMVATLAPALVPARPILCST